ncbi:hypothetical protein EV174_005809 [Coemansia sp. RSA 2320]|nr:hypothetical protein EV174_005809 [Coemansia sp. RSA 2320]
MLWFFPCPPTASASAAASQLQKGVDRVVAANPVLSGYLHERSDSDQDKVRIEYTATGTVQVDAVDVPYTYAELEQSGFNQNMFPLLFDRVPSSTIEIEGLAAFRVTLFALSDGGAVVCLSFHHTMADGVAVVSLAQSISQACVSDEYTPTAMWHDRNRAYEMLVSAQPQPTEQPAAKDVFSEHMHQICSDATLSGTGLQTTGEMRIYQFAVTSSALQRLRESAMGESSERFSSNDLAMALFWRAWARALESHKATFPYTHAGGPIDVRAMAGVSDYLGNMFLPRPMLALRSQVLGQGLTHTAALIRRSTQSATPADLRRFIDAADRGEPDILATVGITDSPSTSFSNIMRMPTHAVHFGLGRLGSMQLRSFPIPFLVFAVGDGAGGFLANMYLPTSVFASFMANQEFTAYAAQVY